LVQDGRQPAGLVLAGKKDEVAMRVSRALIPIFIVLAFGLLTAGAAQAAEWEIEEVPLSSSETAKETTKTSGGIFELTVPKLSLTVKCTSESGTGEIIEGGGTGNASITLSSCVVVGSEVCSVKSPGKSSGTLAATAKTEFFDLEIEEKTEKSYEEFVPTMTVEFSGGKCTLPKELVMKGATAAEVPKLEEESIGRTQKFSEAIAKASGVTSLKLGENQAFLIGEDEESLSGESQGRNMAMTEVTLTPWPIVFGGPGSQTETLKNLGPRWVKFVEIKVVSGPFTSTDSVPCKNGNYLMKNQTCNFTVTCVTGGNQGRLDLGWGVYPIGGGPALGSGGRGVGLLC
jgi:hypothetical protein